MENGQISPGQLAVLTIGFLYGSAAVIAPGRTADQDAWVALLIGYAGGLVIILTFSALALRFPGMSFIEIADEAFGPWVGKLVSLFYLWFLLHIGSLVLRTFSEFFMLFMVETPSMVFSILIVLVAASAVRNGIEVIARCAQIIVPSAFLIVTITFFLLLKDIDMRNFLPAFAVPLRRTLWTAVGVATFPVGESIALMMVFPFVSKQTKIPQALIVGAVFTAALTMVITVNNVGVLGSVHDYYTYPTFQSARLINVGDILTRFEILIGVNLLTMGFIQFSLFYLGVTEGLSRMFKLRTMLPLVGPVGILFVLLSFINFDNIAEHFEFTLIAAPIYSLPFQLGLPLLIWFVALLRNRPKPKPKEARHQ